MAKFKFKRPDIQGEFDAVKWTGDNIDELMKLPNFKLNYTLTSENDLGVYSDKGFVWAKNGDYILGESKGYCVVPEDIFEGVYEVVKDGNNFIYCDNRLSCGICRLTNEQCPKLYDVTITCNPCGTVSATSTTTNTTVTTEVKE